MVSTTQSKGKVAKKRVSSVSKVSTGRAAAASSGPAVKANPKKGVVSTSTKKVPTKVSTTKKVLEGKNVGKARRKGSSAGGDTMKSSVVMKKGPVSAKKEATAAAHVKGKSSGSRSSVKKSSAPAPRKKAVAKTPVKNTSSSSPSSSASKKTKATVAKVKVTPKKVTAKKSRAATHGTKKPPVKKTMKPATKKVAKRPRVAIEASKVFGRSAAKLVSELDQRGISSEVNAVMPRKGYFVVTFADKDKEIVSLPAMPRPFKKLRDLDLVDVAVQIEHALSE